MREVDHAAEAEDQRQAERQDDVVRPDEQAVRHVLEGEDHPALTVAAGGGRGRARPRPRRVTPCCRGSRPGSAGSARDPDRAGLRLDELEDVPLVLGIRSGSLTLTTYISCRSWWSQSRNLPGRSFRMSNSVPFSRILDRLPAVGAAGLADRLAAGSGADVVAPGLVLGRLAELAVDELLREGLRGLVVEPVVPEALPVARERRRGPRPRTAPVSMTPPASGKSSPYSLYCLRKVVWSTPARLR